MRRTAAVLLTLSIVALCAPAEAASRKKFAGARPLTVPATRSFTDYGNGATVDQYRNYVAQSTTLASPVYRYNDRFDENLPGRFGYTGRAQPLFEF